MGKTPHKMESGPVRWLNQVQAAQYLSLSRTTFRRMVDKGILPPGRCITERRRIWDKLELDEIALTSPDA